MLQHNRYTTGLNLEGRITFTIIIYTNSNQINGTICYIHYDLEMFSTFIFSTHFTTHIFVMLSLFYKFLVNKLGVPYILLDGLPPFCPTNVVDLTSIYNFTRLCGEHWKRLLLMCQRCRTSTRTVQLPACNYLIADILYFQSSGISHRDSYNNRLSYFEMLKLTDRRKLHDLVFLH